MRVLIFGATGMVGQGAVNACLLDDSVSLIRTVGRTSCGIKNPKLEDILQRNLFDLKNIESLLSGFDACFFCLGTSSAGKSESEYTKISYDLTLKIAETLARLNPQMTFIYISAVGSDNTEKGPVMWARVRGKLENALFKLPFQRVFVFRPSLILPLDGIESKTQGYRVFYNLGRPALIVLRKLLPSLISTTTQIGRALIWTVKNDPGKKVLMTKDFDAVLNGRPERRENEKHS